MNLHGRYYGVTPKKISRIIFIRRQSAHPQKHRLETQVSRWSTKMVAIHARDARNSISRLAYKPPKMESGSRVKLITLFQKYKRLKFVFSQRALSTAERARREGILKWLAGFANNGERDQKKWRLKTSKTLTLFNLEAQIMLDDCFLLDFHYFVAILGIQISQNADATTIQSTKCLSGFLHSWRYCFLNRERNHWSVSPQLGQFFLKTHIHAFLENRVKLCRLQFKIRFSFVL